MAQASLGRGTGFDHFDHRCGDCGQDCGQPRRDEGSRLKRMGVGINVENLNAWFGAVQALKKITLNIAANHATAIIGPSGCGKSTFVRCLNRMHETVAGARAEGKVEIGGVDIYGNGTSPVQVRRRVGMVFQKANPFPTMSIYDNVAAGLKLNGIRDRHRLDHVVEQSLRRAALWEEVKDFVKKKSGASLS